MVENKKVDFDHWTYLKVAEAVNDILAGKCTKVIVNDNVKVYQCTNVIRVDLKITEES
jgi:hypothetical protein